MNDASSDGNENVIDIFVLCKSERETPLRTEYLEQKGYHVTLFSDSTQLLETLRFGKPNLLVCDSMSLGPEAFEICRQIKADNDLWMIPVLILTGASSLSDLLFVLDCNADNFIAYPYDPPYLLSLIEGMISTHVERQTLEQIKTQFKIQHDDHMFVVTADRRKLLEFLLSSFEIAVNKSDELARAGSANDTLRQANAKADEIASEQGRVISILNTTLQQRDLAISALNDEMKEKSRQIAEHIREKGFFIQERDADKGLIAKTEDHVRALSQQIEEMERSHAEETGIFSEKVSSLTTELAAANSDLASTKEVLEGEVARRSDGEATLEKLVPEKEQLEKSLRALTLECEQLKSSCSAEQNRAQAAEQEVKSLIQTKAASEQDLTRIIDELRATASQQAGDIGTLKDERTSDKNRISALESQLSGLSSEKDQMECGLLKIADDLRRDLSDINAACTTANTTLEDKARRVAELEQDLAAQKNAGEQVQAQARALEAELVAARSAAEEKSREASELGQSLAEQKRAGEQVQAQVRTLEAELVAARSAAEEKSREVSELGQSFAAQKSAGEQVQAKVRALEGELSTMHSALEEKTSAAADLEQICFELKDGGSKALAQIHILDAEIAQLQAAIDAEKQQHAKTRESLQGALNERDAALSSLQGAHEEVKSHLDSHRDNLVLTRQELTVVAEERNTLNGRLADSLGQVRALEAKLHAASGEQAEADKQIRSLSDELDQTRAVLEAERRQRRTGEENIRSAAQAGEKAEIAARQARLEEEKHRALLDAEQKERRNAEERLRALEAASESRIQELSGELAESVTRAHELEEKVRVVTREKLEAEKQAAALETEIDQARSALADEWEDHMTDNERFNAAKEKPRTEAPRPMSPPEPVAADPPRAVVARTSSLPAEIFASPHAIVAVPGTPAESGMPRVTGVDDLFEDEPESTEDPDDLPQVSIVRETDPQVEIDTILCPPVSDEPGPGEEDPLETDEPAGNEDFPVVVEQETDDEYGDEPVDPVGAARSVSSPGQYRSIPATPGIAFNRTQWFDLLKWAHHSGVLSQEQRLQIVRMGRLIQKGRRLTPKQDEQVREMISLVQSLGYRFMQ